MTDQPQRRGSDGNNRSNEHRVSHSSHKSPLPSSPVPNRIIQPRGSKAGTTSKETEIKLTNVGRASLEELLADYRDYLRVRDKSLWEKGSKEAMYVRDLGRRTPQEYESYRNFVETRSDEVIANIAICLIHQTN
jgi:hypothetical protein